MVSLAEQCLLMMVSSQSFKTCCQRMLLQISFVFTSCSLALPMLCAGCSQLKRALLGVILKPRSICHNDQVG